MAGRIKNFIGLLALVGTVVGLIAAGTFYPINPYLALPFAIIAIVSFIGFALFIYRFIFYSPHLEIRPEDMIDPETSGAENDNK